MEIQKYGCMLKISSFGAILLSYDKIAHEGAQNEPNLPLGSSSKFENLRFFGSKIGKKFKISIFELHKRYIPQKKAKIM